jgi:hypothetical protein
MSDLTDRFFGPLGKEWCMYYFAILVFVFIFFVLSIISAGIDHNDHKTIAKFEKLGFEEAFKYYFNAAECAKLSSFLPSGVTKIEKPGIKK